MNLQTLYETDFNSWIQEHISLLKESRFNEIDADHLIEELADMAKKNKTELVNRLVVLLAHLLKWQYQPAFRGNSWRFSIAEQRDQITAGLLEEYPSLQPYLSEAIMKSYARAVKLAAKETQLPLSNFPTQCPYSGNELLDEDFYPSNQQAHSIELAR